VASFVANGAQGYFKLAQVGILYDVSATFCWKFTGVCLGVGNMPDFAQGWLDRFANIRLPNFKDVPVNLEGAESVLCDVRADKAVFLIKMPRPINSINPAVL
jgi:hypothetical protein